MKIHYLIVAILFVSMITLGCVGFLTDLGEKYDSTADVSSLNNTLTRMEETRESTMALSDTITNFKLEKASDFFYIPYVLIKTAWNALLIVFNSWATVQAMIVDVGTGLQDMGIPFPFWFIPTIISVLVIFVVSILIYGFFKWKFDDK